MFVELTPTVLVDPDEVAATVADEEAAGTRVYLRGSGSRSYLLIDLPLAEVVSALLTRPPSRHDPDLTRLSFDRPRPSGGSR